MLQLTLDFFPRRILKYRWPKSQLTEKVLRCFLSINLFVYVCMCACVCMYHIGTIFTNYVEAVTFSTHGASQKRT
jgi:hypothetical protein